MKKYLSLGIILVVLFHLFFFKYCKNNNVVEPDNLKSYENKIKSQDSVINFLTEKNIQLSKTVIHDTEYIPVIQKIYIKEKSVIQNLPLSSNLSYFQNYWSDTLPKLSLINSDSLGLFRKSQISDIRLKFFENIFLKKVDSIKTKTISDLFQIKNTDSLLINSLNEKFKIADQEVLKENKQISDLNLKQKRLRIFGLTAGSLAVIEGLILILRK